MNNFLQTLKARRDGAKKRLELARQGVAAAEADVRKWEAAIELELRTDGEVTLRKTGNRDALPSLLAVTIRRKEDVFRSALEAAGKPVKPTDILRDVQPVLSRSYVYYLVNRMKKRGELEEANGKIWLRSKKMENELKR
ncbi:MAG: hypothetical protein WA416_17160 [Candidatus Sulfotelmatobacter sp.]